jgi:hypothetical protein
MRRELLLPSSQRFLSAAHHHPSDGHRSPSLTDVLTYATDLHVELQEGVCGVWWCGFVGCVGFVCGGSCGLPHFRSLISASSMYSLSTK